MNDVVVVDLASLFVMGVSVEVKFVGQPQTLVQETSTRGIS